MDTPITDDYVISLLQKDSQPSRLNSAFPASKRDKNAPKPNTRFLRNLVRDADSHNAALLAKERAENKARLEGLAQGTGKRSRDGTSNEEEGGVKKRRRENEREGRWKGVLSGLGNPNARERHAKDEGRSGRSRRYEEESSRSQNTKRDEDRTASRREHRSHRRRSPSPDSRSRSPQRSSRRERRRSRSREKAHRDSDDRRRKRSRSRSHNRHDKPRRSRSRSPDRQAKSPNPKPHLTYKDNDNNNPDSDSDPLDSLLGPAPPPTSRPRGRGANNTTATNRSTIDLRFNDPSYNPRTDVAQSDSEAEGEAKDDWSTSLEAIRDRAAWREKGAQRLREAGFGDRDVEKWEGGGREKDERDLRWRGKGEGREWDAGKVTGGEGEVRVKAAWTQGL